VRRTFDLNSEIFTIDPNIIYRRIDEEIILINLKTERIFILNNTGAKLWDYLSEGLTAEQIRSRLLDEFDVEATQLEFELERMIKELTSEKFISPQ
jgi:hypothetical protein